MVEFQAWHGMTLLEHEALRDQWSAQGYRFVSLSIYGAVDNPVYAAVMVKQAEPVAQRDFPVMTALQWQQTFDIQAQQGYGPIILTATGTAADPRFAAVFEPQAPIPLTRHGLTLGSTPDAYQDPATIQGTNYAARNDDGLILRWAASYGTPDDRRFAGIWQPNPDATLWNCDGLDDTPDYYQARFDAETAAWIRPGFVTVGPGNTYMSLFVANEIGPWQARHNMTPGEYQTQFSTLTAEGYFPVCVQASGADAASARFAALFVQQQAIVPRQFTPTGPVANKHIDDVVRAMMQTDPTVRHAALAIVHGTKLVYARGYTLAEPDWPIVQPTTFFRLASVSKLVTALAVFQLLETGALDAARSVQDYLQLKAIGGAPPNPGFASVTIQSLLEHTSGLNDDNNNPWNDGSAVVAAYDNAGITASLPANLEMTDAFIAGHAPETPPGKTQQYSNCGYYLLGRVVAKLRGAIDPITAYQSSLLKPLGITRIRGTVDLLAGQPDDEARYQAAIFPNPPIPFSDLGVYPSQQTPNQPLVADGYGDAELAISRGAGGLSGAVTDVARLVAILLDTNDNPTLKRVTLEQMLSQGAVLTAAQQAIGNPDPRAGFGLDRVYWRSPGVYYGQKGGLIGDAAAVFQFGPLEGESGDGRWGFVALFGSSAYRPNNLVYPNWPDVMKIAKQDLATATDLFPQFGMPSL
jgi:CubicO group peptidase (beta-lactamase class C family)